MLTAFARVRPGSRRRRNRRRTSRSSRRSSPGSIPADYPQAGFRAIGVPLKEELTRSFKPTLWILLGTAGFVLLIVCASIANLLLARMVRREREISVRAALGATRARLLRQLLTESLLLARDRRPARARAVLVHAEAAGHVHRALHGARARDHDRPERAVLHAGRVDRDRAGFRIDSRHSRSGST